MKKDLPTIATLGGHSALEIALGAKKQGFKTLVLAQKGREKVYTRYFSHLFDEVVVVEKFSQLFEKEMVKKLKAKNCLFVPHRYCQVYLGTERLEKNFPIPLFGNRYLLKYEEREGQFNQYQILSQASLPFPKQFSDPQKIDRLVMVKVKEKVRSYERAFFLVSNFREYEKKARDWLKKGKITKEDLKKAVIEEYLVGAPVNFNFFYSPLRERLELLGTDTRRQTNLEGFLRLPLVQQRMVEKFLSPSYIETGHLAVTVKESLLEQAFLLGEKLVETTKKLVPPGIIGPFALQTAVLPGPPKEKIVVFDLSLRIPGSPGSIFTPYSYYLFDRGVSFGERIAQEVKEAFSQNKIQKIIT